MPECLCKYLEEHEVGIISIPGSACLAPGAVRGRWQQESEGQHVLETLRVVACYLGDTGIQGSS